MSIKKNTILIFKSYGIKNDKIKAIKHLLKKVKSCIIKKTTITLIGMLNLVVGLLLIYFKSSKVKIIFILNFMMKLPPP